MQKIIVEEEYGYKYWLWTVDEAGVFEEDLVKYFKEMTSHEHFYSGNPRLPEQFMGEWKELDWEEYKLHIDTNDFDAHAHIHTSIDSHLRFIEQAEIA